MRDGHAMHRIGQQAGRAGRLVLILLGFGITAALVLSADTRALWHDLSAVGAGLIMILALHIAVMAIDSAAWRTLLTPTKSGSFGLLLWARWVRESTNLLLPVAQVGGEVAGARLLVLNGVGLRHAGASVFLDKVAEGISQFAFAIGGLGILVALRGADDLARAIASALIAIGVAIIGLFAVGHGGGFAGVERWVRAAAGRLYASAEEPIVSIATTIKLTCSTPRLAHSASVHLIAWCLGSGEVWLALRIMGHPISVEAALAIESLGSMVAAAGFMVPGAIGVQESGYMAISAGLGLPAELGLAMSLVKRARQILLGLPALASWQAVELIWLPGRLPTRRRRTPSSASNSVVRRALRVLLRPLAATRLTPNHLTTLRILTGAAAAACCGLGTVAAGWWAGGFWIASCILDRADGELARITGQCSRLGHLYDYAGDVVLNSGIFLAMGIGLTNAATGPWPLVFGAWATLTIATASIIADVLERRIGEKSFPSRAGFDFDDILFVFAPVWWSGHTLALLIGAAIGAPIAGLFLLRRLTRLGITLPRPRLLTAD